VYGTIAFAFCATQFGQQAKFNYSRGSKQYTFNPVIEPKKLVMKKVYSVVTAFLISMVGFSQDTASTNKDLYKTTIYSATLFNKNKILARDYLSR